MGERALAKCMGGGGRQGVATRNRERHVKCETKYAMVNQNTASISPSENPNHHSSPLVPRYSDHVLQYSTRTGCFHGQNIDMLHFSFLLMLSCLLLCNLPNVPARKEGITLTRISPTLRVCTARVQSRVKTVFCLCTS